MEFNLNSKFDGSKSRRFSISWNMVLLLSGKVREGTVTAAGGSALHCVRLIVCQCQMTGLINAEGTWSRNSTVSSADGKTARVLLKSD